MSDGLDPERESDDRRLQSLEDYWRALRAGAESDAAYWLQTHADAATSAADLQLLATFFEARQILAEDSQDTLQGQGGQTFLAPGTRIRDYCIESLLGCGGMGEVYLAHHTKLNRRVAIKVLPDDLAKDPVAIKRFQRSVQLLARLDPHPNLAWAMDAGEQDGLHFLVMEHVAGQNLKTVVQREGPLKVDRACAIIRQAALGLDHAHRARIIHRDVKPSNLILADDGMVRLIDFGLARHHLIARTKDGDSSLTQIGAVLGTLDYLAPEQALDPRCADARSDLYSLGCTFYFLLSGAPPFADRDPFKKVVAHAFETPAAIQSLRADVPAAVAEVVHRLLAKTPKDRYPSARALIDALDSLNFSPPGARQTSQGNRRWLGVALVVLALSFLPLAYLFGPQVNRIATNKGELVIETDEANIEVTIKQDGAAIIDPTTRRRIDLTVGDYEIELSGAKEGFQLSAKQFTLTRGGRAIVKVWWEPPVSRQPKNKVRNPLDIPRLPTSRAAVVDDAWLKRIASLPPGGQIEAVREKLIECNPGFDGKLLRGLHRGGAVFSLSFPSDQVKDISPLRALPGLEFLNCDGSPEGNGQIADLAPLKSMKKLQVLQCQETRVVDLSPLRGMPLTHLDLIGTKVTDLRPLKNSL
ncbi:MAG: protein kinase [Planctomycetes bacterium]|nr:protein kinase [Planctomycetota bacterium]